MKTARVCVSVNNARAENRTITVGAERSLQLACCNIYNMAVITQFCATEAEGFWFGSNYGLGIAVLELRPPQTTTKDEIAFGFMTWGDSGTLLRVDGDALSDHFIQAQLVRTF